MFKKSKERNKIVNEVLPIFDKKAEFSCFVDGIFEYNLIVDDVKHVFV